MRTDGAALNSPLKTEAHQSAMAAVPTTAVPSGAFVALALIIAATQPALTIARMSKDKASLKHSFLTRMSTWVSSSGDFKGKVRTDRRCGPEFPLLDGSPSQCDPDSAEHFCCSKWGFCGGDAEHCDCPTCFNFKLLS